MSTHHELIANRVEKVSMALGILSGVSAIAAIYVEPTGLDAFGVWLGFTSEPLVITAAPILGFLATVFGMLSGIAYFYSLTQQRKASKKKAAAETHES
jgi:hypothetical protein